MHNDFDSNEKENKFHLQHPRKQVCNIIKYYKLKKFKTLGVYVRCYQIILIMEKKERDY